MIIRKYKQTDCAKITKLFYETVHTVCCGDYSQKQLNAWAQCPPDEQIWNETFIKSYTVVAEIDGIIVGFGNIKNDYLDRLYVHKNYQKQGIGASIVAKLESHALQNKYSKIYTHASITALPFFKKLGYENQNRQTVIRLGVELTNFVMTKTLI